MRQKDEKTGIYVLFLIAGMIAGCIATNYYWSWYHKEWASIIHSGELGKTAMHAQLLKEGETAYVLGLYENSIPEMVKFTFGLPQMWLSSAVRLLSTSFCELIVMTESSILI